MPCTSHAVNLLNLELLKYCSMSQIGRAAAEEIAQDVVTMAADTRTRLRTSPNPLFGGVSSPSVTLRRTLAI